MLSERRNLMLSRFLKAQRASLSPGDVGLPQYGRRRTPGLRREEVASLAGVSASWYTSLEQGRDISVSTSVLERLCKVLQLNATEREFLFALVHRRPAPLRPAAPNDHREASSLVWRTLDAMTVPALAMTYRWDVIAWNELSLCFRDYTKLPPGGRNLLKLMVNDPAYKSDPELYDEKIRLAVSRLRVDYCQVGEDAALDELIADLAANCPLFERYWNESSSLGPSEAANTLHHPELGCFSFRHSVYVPKAEPHLRIVVFVPRDAQCAEKLAQLLSLRQLRAPGGALRDVPGPKPITASSVAAGV